MTSHSERTAFIRGYAVTQLEAQHGVSGGASRDGIVNNLRHLHDESGQMVCNLAIAAGSNLTQSSPSTSVFQLLDGLCPQRFQVRRRGDTGNSFLIVVRLRVSISSAGTATFRLQLDAGDGFALAPTGTDTNVAEFSTTNTTGETIEETVYLSAAQLARGGMFRDAVIGETGSPSLRADGSLGRGEYFMGALSLWAKSSAGAPRLHGMMAREYVGD